MGNVSLRITTIQCGLVVAHHLGDYEVQELLGELWIKLGILGQRAQSRNLLGLPCGIGRCTSAASMLSMLIRSRSNSSATGSPMALSLASPASVASRTCELGHKDAVQRNQRHQQPNAATG